MQIKQLQYLVRMVQFIYFIFGSYIVALKQERIMSYGVPFAMRLAPKMWKFFWSDAAFILEVYELDNVWIIVCLGAFYAPIEYADCDSHFVVK